MRRVHPAAMSCAIVMALSFTGSVQAQGPQRGERGGGMWYEHGPGWGMGMFGCWGPRPHMMLERVRGTPRLHEGGAEDHGRADHRLERRFADAVRAAAKQHNERMKAIMAGDAPAPNHCLTGWTRRSNSSARGSSRSS